MKTVMRHKILALTGVALLILGSVGLSAAELTQSYFEQELQNTRYASLAFLDELDDKENSEDAGLTSGAGQSSIGWDTKELSYQKKSPAKAFLLSLALPGAGQYYYGAKKKAIAFLGVEAMSLLFHIKWHGIGESLTDDFIAFHKVNWTRENYVNYLVYVHGDSTDANINEFTHQLPATNSQQYYEMTGKYDQFLWGWEDTHRADDSLNITEHINNNTPPDQLRLIGEPDLFPTSEKRLIYEEMRLDANNKFDQAQKALYVTMFNHLISAFEAFVTTRKRNTGLSRAESEFSRLQVRARFMSIYASKDTPYLDLTYRF